MPAKSDKKTQEAITELSGRKSQAVLNQFDTDKITLPEGNTQIFASKYQTVFPTKEELKKL